MQAAFNAIKDTLAMGTLLVHPQLNAQLAVMTDVAVGDVLKQHVNGQWLLISYFSWKLKPLEVRYSAFHRELLAIYLSIRHFIHMVGRCLHRPQATDIPTLPGPHSTLLTRFFTSTLCPSSPLTFGTSRVQRIPSLTHSQGLSHPTPKH